jgi:hypothetical protein
MAASDMQEMVTVEQAERVIGALTYALPVAGIVLGSLIGALRKRMGRGAAVGLACGLSGPAIWLLWRMYNGVVGGYGLDSVRGLLVNLGLFVAIGLVIGVAVGLVWRRLSKQAA